MLSVLRYSPITKADPTNARARQRTLQMIRHRWWWWRKCQSGGGGERENERQDSTSSSKHQTPNVRFKNLHHLDSLLHFELDLPLCAGPCGGGMREIYNIKNKEECVIVKGCHTRCVRALCVYTRRTPSENLTNNSMCLTSFESSAVGTADMVARRNKRRYAK